MPRNQIELIEHYTKEFNKVVESHGLTSDYATNAFFVLQGAKMGKPLDKLFTWANSECERLHQITLDSLPAFQPQEGEGDGE